MKSMAGKFSDILPQNRVFHPFPSGCSIEFIAHNRMPLVGQMDTDLMGSAGFQTEVQNRKHSDFLHNLETGYRITPITANRHFFAVRAGTPDRLVNYPGFLP